MSWRVRWMPLEGVTVWRVAPVRLETLEGKVSDAFFVGGGAYRKVGSPSGLVVSNMCPGITEHAVRGLS